MLGLSGDNLREWHGTTLHQEQVPQHRQFSLIVPLQWLASGTWLHSPSDDVSIFLLQTAPYFFSGPPMLIYKQDYNTVEHVAINKCIYTYCQSSSMLNFRLLQLALENLELLAERHNQTVFFLRINHRCSCLKLPEIKIILKKKTLSQKIYLLLQLVSALLNCTLICLDHLSIGDCLLD